MTDPTIDNTNGIITLNFDSSTNWTLSKTEITPIFGGGSLILYPQNQTFWEEFDSSSLDLSADWRTNDMMAQSTDNNFIRISNYEAFSPLDNEALTSRAHMPLNPTGTNRTVGLWFYDQGGSSGGEVWHTLQTNVVSITARGILSIGWDAASSAPNKYVYSKSGGASTDTGITRSADWHHAILQTRQDFVDPDTFYNRKIVLDGVTVLSETSTTAFGTAYRGYSLNIIDATNTDIHVDEVLFGSGNNEVFEVGTAQIDIAPESVKEFSTYSIDENTTGAWLGTTLYEISFSTDNGLNFGTNYPDYNNGLFLTLSNYNLNSFICAGDGQDKLRLKITHTPDATISNINKLSIPKTNQVVINFKPGGRYPFEYFKQD